MTKAEWMAYCCEEEDAVLDPTEGRAFIYPHAVYLMSLIKSGPMRDRPRCPFHLTFSFLLHTRPACM